MFYSWGCGHDGRLGSGNEENSKEPTPIYDLIQKAVYRKIASSLSTNEKKPKPAQQQQQQLPKKKNAFGIQVENNQIAAQEETKKEEKEVTANSPTSLPYFNLRVNRVFAGGYHTFVECVLESDEESVKHDDPNALLLSFGGNEHGQLGVGDSSARTSAQIVEPFLFFSTSKNLQRVKYISKEKQKEYQEHHAAVARGSKSGTMKLQSRNDDVDEKESEDSWADIGSASSHFSEAILAKKKKRNTRGANFDISSEPYLWYRSEDLIDIKCGRYHSIAWVSAKDDNNNCRSEIYVCGRNDSGQLGLGASEREDKTIFVEATSVVRIQQQQTEINKNNSEIIDVSCGAYHSCVLFGPKDCFLKNCVQENLRQHFIQEWIRNQVQKNFLSHHQKSKSPTSKSQNRRQNSAQEDEQEREEDEEKDFVKQQLESLKSQFSVFSCGRGDCGELGVDGDDEDAQADFERRIKAAVVKQHHRKQQMMTDGSNNHNNAAMAGTSSWALQDRQQQMNQNNIFREGENGSSFMEGGVGEEEDETITSILDPAKRNNNDKLHAQAKFDSKNIFRVALLRDLWTRIDLSNERIHLAASAENNSSNFVVTIPFGISASYQRTSIQCVKISFSSFDENIIISENIWLSFGAFYHNKRETLESSIPCQVIAPTQQQIMNIVGIEDCEILFTETEIFVRGGPRCLIIPGKIDHDDEVEGGESEDWTKISEKMHEKLSFPSTPSSLSQKIKIENVFPQGKGFIALVSQKKSKVETPAPRRRPLSASSSKSEDNDDDNNNNNNNNNENNDDDDDNDASRIEFRLVSFGDNFYGQLGVGDEIDRIGGNCDLVQSKFLVDAGEDAFVFDSNHKISFSVGVCHCGLMF